MSKWNFASWKKNDFALDKTITSIKIRFLHNGYKNKCNLKKCWSCTVQCKMLIARTFPNSQVVLFFLIELLSREIDHVRYDMLYYWALVFIVHLLHGLLNMMYVRVWFHVQFSGCWLSLMFIVIFENTCFQQHFTLTYY